MNLVVYDQLIIIFLMKLRLHRILTSVREGRTLVSEILSTSMALCSVSVFTHKTLI
jgi:hypothetical protein